MFTRRENDSRRTNILLRITAWTQIKSKIKKLELGFQLELNSIAIYIKRTEKPGTNWNEDQHVASKVLHRSFKFKLKRSLN